jgi:hypothetical protein
LLSHSGTWYIRSISSSSPAEATRSSALLKPAFSHGRTHCIAASNWGEIARLQGLSRSPNSLNIRSVLQLEVGIERTSRAIREGLGKRSRIDKQYDIGLLAANKPLRAGGSRCLHSTYSLLLLSIVAAPGLGFITASIALSMSLMMTTGRLGGCRTCIPLYSPHSA